MVIIVRKMLIWKRIYHLVDLLFFPHWIMHRPQWFHGTYATYIYKYICVCVLMHSYEYTMRVAAAFQTKQRPVFVYFLAFHLCAYFKLTACMLLMFTFNSVTSFLSIVAAVRRYVSCNRSKWEKLTDRTGVRKKNMIRTILTTNEHYERTMSNKSKSWREEEKHQYGIREHAMALWADTQ